ncbi:DNA polymerase III subunit delta' [Pseudoclavibacter sp. RFBJ3]|uniref:DNA polymerase III subunit delta' n=1 Tax=unclassified Pseudoclavibacter TaxID=2615177 RepID=UPI000CE782D2|nr:MULTISPECIES: DNA polymerase III subunit delta' [unclassified Pseudoclavibacter]MBF4458412.1 DNA polymerase III subunit delta' [Pseudoclavibacter sp. VKM Ac-2867]PPF74548.1 DNA polymerase III subunit delta' [Pseudoclavibacter sp. Z016]PPF82579.1 DNA polymerase III subunit delta' [Pseudoclavibacter sp. RFBJ5]PPF91473.1 DNA polymerase III subunit delta' [Pseudoclavibacter sp. RFBJ3]PPF96397.1 DNA polymerase III subunit delta' [Pseudoclavibacter sp. RFBH5]
MTVWDDLSGQDDAIALFSNAAKASKRGAIDPSGMTNSWLITGPPGSGRSNMAYAFAAALLCPDGGCGVCPSCVQVRARSHPDLTAVVTETVQLDIKTARELVERASMSPMTGRYRVIIVEDADRMVARTSNTLLKAIEEPPESTVWVLCAPSEADLLPTIRSRVRSVRLRVPAVRDVAALLVRRDGIEPDTALRAAREAQSHVGMAKRLATSEDAWGRRDASLDGLLDIRTTGEAVRKAAQLVTIADEDATANAADRDEHERAAAFRSLGLTPGQAVPRQLRGQIRELEEHQKRRAKRGQVDAIDRILTDSVSLLRDLLMLQLELPVELVNEHRRSELEAATGSRSSDDVLTSIDAVSKARARLAANVPVALVLEAFLISWTQKQQGAS